MLNALVSRFWPSDRKPADPARDIYASIVAQARQPEFYARWGVPDTVEGRFEMITLHAALLFRRLRGNDAEKRFAQEVFDVFFEDMDGSLREMGVGDIVVPKRIAAMGEAFYGRAQAYGTGLDATDPDILADAAARNLIGLEDETAARTPSAQALGRYIRSADAALSGQSTQDILAGRVNWPAPEEGRSDRPGREREAP